MNKLDGLDDEYVEPIRATLVEGILQPALRMRDMVPPKLPTGRVTLLGDAVHPMVPCKKHLSFKISQLTPMDQFEAKVATWPLKMQLF